jgi:hypothetical protein
MIGEKQREDMRDFLVKAYADGVLPEEGLESRLRELEALAEPAALVAMVEQVKALYAAPVPGGAATELPAAEAAGGDSGPPAQLVRGVGMNAKRRGRWFTSERIRIELDRSNVVLDFSELASFAGIFMELSLDLRGSNVTMLFPKGTMLSEDLENIGSNVNVTRRGDNLYRLTVRLRGRVEGTNLRAKTRALY